MSLSIIIPTLNEEKHIERTLRILKERAADAEIVVVDGESTDDTVALASRYVRVLSAKRGRGGQLNAGVRATSALPHQNLTRGYFSLLLMGRAEAHSPKEDFQAGTQGSILGIGIDPQQWPGEADLTRMLAKQGEDQLGRFFGG